jgi:hypothetical protein
VTAADDTVELISDAPNWDDRVMRIRQIPARHGTDDQTAIYAQVARRLYVPHLAPDYAYVHSADFYSADYFHAAYAVAARLTKDFTSVAVESLATALVESPRILLPLRVITGLTRTEFADSTALTAELLESRPLPQSRVDSMERRNVRPTPDEAMVAAETIDRIVAGTLFGDPPGDLKSKQDKSDTAGGWSAVSYFAQHGVPYEVLLHQRHYGGAFRQLLDATSEKRGNILEDAVEALFRSVGVLYIRTGAHNHAELVDRFEVTVLPSPDFVVYDARGALRAMLECKGANDGGTARDKALRFSRLHDESTRLGGIPLIAVLGGLGWKRVNDTLGLVVKACDGRVFSLPNLPEMLTVSPFSSLVVGRS